MTKDHKPPRIAEWLLKEMFSDNKNYTTLGDLEEVFQIIANQKNIFKAWEWYWIQLAKSVPYYCYNFAYWRVTMLSNYFKIALRIIRKHKVYSLINITGLSLGMACCMVILLFVHRELTYDKFHKNSDRIYRLCRELKYPVKRGYATSQFKIPPMMAEEFPEIINFVRINRQFKIKMIYKGRQFETVAAFTDPSFFEMFTFPMVKGVPELAFAKPHSIVLTEKLAHKLFGDEDPIGRVISIQERLDLLVTGILKDIPENSHIQFEFLSSFESLKEIIGDEKYQKGVKVYTYLLFKKVSDTKGFNEKISAFIKKHMGERSLEFQHYFLQSLTSIHLHSDLVLDWEKNSNPKYSIYLSTLAILIMLIACINFMNLSSARAVSRAKEVGIRKIMGAQRLELAKQFFIETMLLSLLAFVFAVCLSNFLIPYFNNLAEQNLRSVLLVQPQIIIYLLVMVVLSGAVSGSYPALLLSAFQAVNVLKVKIRSNVMTVGLRKGLVVFQFMLSTAFIIYTLVIMQQFEYMQNKDLGFNKEHMIIVPIYKDRTMIKRMGLLKNTLFGNQDILSATACNATPGYNHPYIVVQPEDFSVAEQLQVSVIEVDQDYLKTFGIDLVMGRNFSREYATDAGRAVLINEAAVKKFGWKNPLGKNIRFWDIETTVVGVVRDFHFESLQRTIGPCIYHFYPDYLSAIAIRIAPQHIPRTIEFIKDTWYEFSPNTRFSYTFLDQALSKVNYKEEKRIERIIHFATCLAVLISSLGLLGLATFATERRIKEIGIRKVLGSSISGIIYLLSKNFIMLVVIANILAWPVAYYFMNRWLQNFAYRFHFTIFIPLGATLLSMMIALITIIFHAIKAARANPVEALRYE